jgi:hypothetical protein
MAVFHENKDWIEDAVTEEFVDKGKKQRRAWLAAGVAAAVFLLLSACGGSSSSSGPPPPLPNDQTGSLVSLYPTYNNSPANCYISDNAVCSPSTTGANPITALAAATISSNNFLYWGDGGGNIYSTSSLLATPPSSSSSLTSCFSSSGSVGTKILSIAVVPSSSELFYATSGGTYEGTLSSGACHTSFSTSPSPLPNAAAGSLTYNAATNLVIGVTGSAQYFFCTTAPICTNEGSLPGLVDISPQITAIASDPNPNYAIVYVLAIGVNTGRIYAYQVGSSGTLTYLTNYSGTELNGPSGVALFSGNTGTQNFCTTGPCTFMDVTNSGNTTITQYVVTYSFSGTTPNGVSINQFNNAYYNCDLVNPGPIAALPGSSGSLNNPDVFVGERGPGTVPCLGLTSGSFGNNITAYTVTNE